MSSTKTLHATSVAVKGQAVLIIGASGAGKSSLALDLISRGAALISDDQTIVHEQDGALIASAPAPIQGQIEVRGVGVLAVKTTGPSLVTLVVDLDQTEPKRLPDHHVTNINSVNISVIYGGKAGNLAPAILVWLQGGRID